ncbi:uncharacterized protein LOC126385240 [Scomber scombrus]|uniref:Uncharacterized protein LOC126385240 n=1 Tax=Scomber scombrus TaxID=13677 RepID=A0AAV1Q813_SCOSC
MGRNMEERFLLHADNVWGIQVFATDENLTLLRQCRTTYMDATFKSGPRPYRQCFTILGNHHGFILPLVHVLKEQRTIGHYRQVFQAVKVAIRRVTHHNWRPQLVVCDFENALKIALETEFPKTRVGGCYFHFNQSLWRRIQKLGLAAPSQQDCSLARVICKLMALGYLPLALVQMNFTTLVNGRRGNMELDTHLARQVEDSCQTLHLKKTYANVFTTSSEVNKTKKS